MDRTCGVYGIFGSQNALQSITSANEETRMGTYVSESSLVLHCSLLECLSVAACVGRWGKRPTSSAPWLSGLISLLMMIKYIVNMWLWFGEDPMEA